jgi:ABC-type Na+ transport system ATPase subunit NatA
MDEIGPADHVIVLHRGSVLRDDRADVILAETGGATMAEAFMTLTRETA